LRGVGLQSRWHDGVRANWNYHTTAAYRYHDVDFRDLRHYSNTAREAHGADRPY